MNPNLVTFTSPDFVISFQFDSHKTFNLTNQTFSTNSQLFDFLTAKLPDFIPTFNKFISLRPRSVQEVKRYLQTKLTSYSFTPNSPAFWDKWLKHMIQNHVINSDADFVYFWVTARSHKTPRSLWAIKYELRQKGVDPNLIDTVIDRMIQNGEYDEIKALQNLYRRYRHKPLLKFKQAAYRHRFQPDTIKRFLQTLPSPTNT